MSMSTDDGTAVETAVVAVVSLLMIVGVLVALFVMTMLCCKRPRSSGGRAKDAKLDAQHQPWYLQQMQQQQQQQRQKQLVVEQQEEPPHQQQQEQYVQYYVQQQHDMQQQYVSQQHQEEDEEQDTVEDMAGERGQYDSADKSSTPQYESLLIALPSCFNSFGHGVIPTSFNVSLMCVVGQSDPIMVEMKDLA